MISLLYSVRRSFRRFSFPDVALAASFVSAFAVATVALVHWRVISVPPRGLRDPDQIRRIFVTRKQRSFSVAPVLSEEEVAHLRDGEIGAVAAYVVRRVSFATNNTSDDINAVFADSALLEILGVRPTLGPATMPSCAESLGSSAAISFRLARRVFGSPRAAIGKGFSMDGRRIAVAAVLPSGFDGIDYAPADVWLSRCDHYNSLSPQSRTYFLSAVVRLPEHRPESIAERRATALLTRIPESTEVVDVRLRPLFADRLGSDVVQRLVPYEMSLAAAFIILALSTSALLITVDAVRRSQDMRIASALGATSSQMWCELAALKVILVFGCATACLAFFTMFKPVLFGEIDFSRHALDRWLIGSMAVFSFLLPVTVFGVQTWRKGRHAILGGPHRLWRLQAILFVGLVASIGLACWSVVDRFVTLKSVQLGFDPRNAVVIRVQFDSLHTSVQKLEASERAIERLNLLPLVAGSVVSTSVPFAAIQNGPIATLQGDSRGTDMYFVYGNLPAALGLTLQTQAASARGTIISGKAAIVNQALAEALRLRNGDAVYLPDGERLTIIGMVNSTRTRDLESPPFPIIYAPLTSSRVPPFVYFVVRMKGQPTRADVRRIELILASELPAARLRASLLSSIVEQQTASLRLFTQMNVALLLMACLLAAFGLTTMVRFNLQHVEHTIAVMSAVGCSPRRLFLKHAKAPSQDALAGLGVGLLVGIWGKAALVSRIVGIPPGVSLYELLSAIVAPAGLLALSIWPLWRRCQESPATLLGRRVKSPDVRLS